MKWVLVSKLNNNIKIKYMKIWGENYLKEIMLSIFKWQVFDGRKFFFVRKDLRKSLVYFGFFQ